MIAGGLLSDSTYSDQVDTIPPYEELVFSQRPPPYHSTVEGVR